MAIQNINALVDKYSLSYLENSEYITKYYNEALANLGQRNTEELLLKYNSFTLRELFRNYIENIDNYQYLNIKIDENSYSILTEYNLCDSSLYEITNITENLNTIEDNTNEQILFNRKFDIIRKLAKKLVKENDKDIDDQGVTEHKMFIPLDYEITYVCNGINEMILYYGRNDLYVYIIPSMVDDQEYILKFKDVIFVKHSHNYLKTVVYNYNFYRDESTLKYEVNVYRKFILPYIDEENIWQVNRINTGICAQGKDALELNIITVYQNFIGANTKLDILSGLSNITEINSNIEYPEVYIKYGSSSFKLICHLPNIQISNNVYNNIDINDIIKNSTIILICPVNYFLHPDNGNNINKEIIEEYGKDGLITTIWTYKEDSWEYLSIETDSKGNRLALDLNRLTNFNAIIDYKISKLKQTEPDNFLYRHLIFENSIQNTKQHTGTISTIYGVIQNLKGSNYNDKYINNLNLSFRYLNTIDGIIGKDILNVYNTNSVRYLKFFNVENSNYITNSLYYTKENNKTNYYNEFVPNYNVPTLDLSEVLVKDSNVMNKQNVLSFDSNGHIYYSYFGTSFNDIDKSIVRLGTSKINVNIGNNTMVSDMNKNKFMENTALSIDFKKIYINGNTNITNDLELNGNLDIDGTIWKHRLVDDSSKIIYSNIVPIFKYIYKDYIYNIINLNNFTNDLLELKNIYNRNKYSEDDEIHLYFNIILCHQLRNNENYYYKYNDLLYIPALLNKIKKTVQNIDNYTITSDTNQIINIITDSGNIPTFFVSSDNKLSKYISIQSSKTNFDLNSINIINKSSNVFFGCPLDIIIDKNQQRIIINEHKSYKLNSIWKLPSNISEKAL